MLVVAVVVLGVMLACYLRVRMAVATNAPTPGESAPADVAWWGWMVAALAVLACLTCVLAQ